MIFCGRNHRCCVSVACVTKFSTPIIQQLNRLRTGLVMSLGWQDKVLYLQWDGGGAQLQREFACQLQLHRHQQGQRGADAAAFTAHVCGLQKLVIIDARYEIGIRNYS